MEKTRQFLFSGKLGYRSLILLILPTILLIVGFYYLKCSGYFFLKCVDPEYAYLFNGLLLADMHPDVPYIDHPGTPLQCIIALVIRIVKLFRPGSDMISDVLKNPEIYIHATIYVLNILGASMMFILGVFTYKKTGNIYLAFLVQLIPFMHRLGMETLARLIPESFMLPLICIWIIVFIWMATDPDLITGMKKYSIILGMLFGLCVANKLTFLPFVILPLFILHGWKNKLLFAGVSTGAFFVCAFPILFKYKSFYFWVRNMIFHTGKYGSGDPGIFHMQEFTDHIKLLIENTPFLVMALLILALTGIIYFIKSKRENQVDKLYANAAMGLIFVVIMQYVFSAKEFSYHYMLPSILLTFPMIIFSFIMMTRVFASRNMRLILNLILAVIVVYILSIFTPNVRTQLKEMNNNKNLRMESFLQFEKSRSIGATIISASYYGCSAVEYALTFGIHLSGNYNEYLTTKMKALYPLSFLYFPWGKTFYAGNKVLLPSAFLIPERKYNLYIADYTPDRYNEIVKALKENNDSLQFNINQIFINITSAEALFILQTKK